MERNGKLALSQILIGVATFILAIVLVVIGVKMKSDSSFDNFLKIFKIVVIAINVVVLILAVLQIVFGGMDKMWLGMSSGIICLSSSIIGFIGVGGWVSIIAGIALLVLNIITAVKSKSFQKA